MIEPNNIIAMQSNRPQNIFYVHWNLGKRCNYDCVYCSDTLHDLSSPHRSLENLIEIATKMKLNIPSHKLIRIWFTGGEPTVNPNFLKFCKWLYADDRFLIGLNTNGSRSAKYLLDLMQYVNVLQFSSHFQYLKEDDFLHKLKTVNDYAKNTTNKSMSLNLMMEPEYWDLAIRMIKFCNKYDINYHLKRIRPKPNISTKEIQYQPIYTTEQIKFLNDINIRNNILKDDND